MRQLLLLPLIVGLTGCDKGASKGAPFEVAGRDVIGKAPLRKAAGALGPAGGEEAAPAEKEASRKIIYTASIELIVADFDNVRERMPLLAEQFDGFIGNSKLEATSGDRRRATWTLRIPVAKFRPTMAALEQLGHIVNTNSDSQDVTDEFYDLEARVTTKKEEEKALREILAKSAIKLEDIMTMRRELTRIREEIEVAQGRLNKLSKLSDLTTITVVAQERKDYLPPTTPTFKGRIGETFTESAEALWNILKGIAIGIVALVPWLPLLLIPAAVVYLLVRVSRRAGPATTQVVAVETVPPPADQPPTSV